MNLGHSEMECDSVHSTIETIGRLVDVFTHDKWYRVARTAKINRRYQKVVEMEYSDFLDNKKYIIQVIKMKWLKVK